MTSTNKSYEINVNGLSAVEKIVWCCRGLLDASMEVVVILLRVVVTGLCYCIDQLSLEWKFYEFGKI